MVPILGLTGVRDLARDTFRLLLWTPVAALSAVSNCRRDTREHLMLGFSEITLARASVVTSAPDDRDAYRCDRHVAGRPLLGQTPVWLPDHEGSPCST
jgi:hypothetical protein